MPISYFIEILVWNFLIFIQFLGNKLRVKLTHEFSSKVRQIFSNRVNHLISKECVDDIIMRRIPDSSFLSRRSVVKMAAQKSVPSDLFKCVYSFLLENKFTKAAEQFLKQTKVVSGSCCYVADSRLNAVFSPGALWWSCPHRPREELNL